MKATKIKLNTSEDFLLLCIDPENGGFMFSDQQITYGLVGAILLDLSLNEKIEIIDDSLHFKNLHDDHPVLNEINKIYRKDSDHKKLKFWINKLSRKSHKIKWELLWTLKAKNYIGIHVNKFLGIFPYRKCYIIEHEIRSDKLHNLRASLLSAQYLVSENMALLSLIEACKMYKLLTNDREEVKRIKSDLKEIIKENPIAIMVDRSLKDIHAAVVAAATTASVAASLSTK